MKFVVIFAAVLVTLVIALPAKPNFGIDIYKRTLTLATSRIFAGQNAERNQFPYQISLRWGILGIQDHICGGSLITENVVLTAAHCKPYDFGTYDVVLGQLNQGESNADVQVINAAQFIIHEKYPGGGVVAPDDIGVIILEKPAVLSAAVQTVPLGDDADCDALEDAVVSGWGLTEWPSTVPTTLQWVKLPRITNQQCGQDLTNILGSAGPLDETMICIGSSSDPFKGSCRGDSGGPLVRDSNKKLVGVVSWGIAPCGAATTAPSVFTRVCSHRDWIAQHL